MPYSSEYLIVTIKSNRGFAVMLRVKDFDMMRLFGVIQVGMI